MTSSRPRSSSLALLAAVGLGLALTATLWHRRQRASDPPDATPLPGTPPTQNPPPSYSSPVATVTTVAPATPATPDTCLATVMAGDSASARGSGLSALKESLHRLDREAAATWIIGQLDAGTDAETGSDLILEADHALSGWTSLRVFLLDTLFAIDPAASRSPSLHVLDQPASPDEWALALRNLCLGPQAAEDLVLVKARTAELVANRAWQEQPTSGYLEAFDFVVHTRHLECLPTLMDLCGRTSNPAVRHAAHLALDRLLQAEPRPVLDSLATASIPPAIRPMTANLVARADMRDPVQKARLESYLVDPQRTPEEIRVFTSVFPNANYAVSRNLVTPPVVDTNDDRPERDAIALAAVEEWLRDPRFSRLHEPLAVTRQRLAGFVGR